jgi:cholestenol delta-isomerase
MVATGHPFRYPLQAVVSLGQLYGDVLYYATSMFDHYILNLSYSRPEAFYFWGYFVFMNLFWIIIPLSEFLEHRHMHTLVLIGCRTSIRQCREKW